jgi:hypothetical protein
MTKYLALAVCWGVLLTCYVNAADCRWFGREARAAIGGHVAALQRLEHEASDRLKGLDSRPYEFLVGEARRITAIIADPAALKDEEGLQRCRNLTRPLRKICAGAAQMLVDALDQHGASATPAYDKLQYAAAMAECEKAMGLKALKSSIRGAD